MHQKIRLGNGGVYFFFTLHYFYFRETPLQHFFHAVIYTGRPEYDIRIGTMFLQQREYAGSMANKGRPASNASMAGVWVRKFLRVYMMLLLF